MKKLRLSIIFIVAGLLLSGILFYQRVTYNPPPITGKSRDTLELLNPSEDYYVLGNSWLRKNKNGNWESYVEGSGYELGTTLGRLHAPLIKAQEVAFVNSIKDHVPSSISRRLLLAGVAWFNRNLDQTIPLEFRQEIYGTSVYSPDEYDFIGPKYTRILNYHAAHDIGHAVQNMHLVGCTVFGRWSNTDSSSYMIMGRNFDFYFGEDFAKNKVVLFVNPSRGHRFISVSWAGFSGVVSGMNEKGLGITLNSSKSEIPKQTGTPVSIVAREILQYASNLEEAVEIAKKYRTFVSESFTISSAEDGKIAVIEKTPESMGFYLPEDNEIIVTNHFQSPELDTLAVNLEHIKDSETLMRYRRTSELMQELDTLDEFSALKILRDKQGIGGSSIGLSNPQAINQLLAHHAVIFSNYDRLIWVSNYPYQENYFDAYSFENFGELQGDRVKFPISISEKALSPDPFYLSEDFGSFMKYREMTQDIKEATAKRTLLSDSFIQEFKDRNPDYYLTYQLLGDYFNAVKKSEQAKKAYNMALQREIPYQEDKSYLEEQISELTR